MWRDKCACEQSVQTYACNWGGTSVLCVFSCALRGDTCDLWEPTCGMWELCVLMHLWPERTCTYQYSVGTFALSERLMWGNESHLLQIVCVCGMWILNRYVNNGGVNVLNLDMVQAYGVSLCLIHVFFFVWYCEWNFLRIICGDFLWYSFDIYVKICMWNWPSDYLLRVFSFLQIDM